MMPEQEKQLRKAVGHMDPDTQYQDMIIEKFKEKRAKDQYLAAQLSRIAGVLRERSQDVTDIQEEIYQAGNSLLELWGDIEDMLAGRNYLK